MNEEKASLWLGFHREAFVGAWHENVLLRPDESFHCELEDPSKPGCLETPALPMAPFDWAVVSWNAITPPGSWLELALRARIQARWTAYYPLAQWSSDPSGPRHSFADSGDADGHIDADTLKLNTTADSLQIRVQLIPGISGSVPALTGLAAVTRDSHAPALMTPRPPHRTSWGLELKVPPLSQMPFPKGARSWCSPVCVTMILEFWESQLGRKLADPIPTAAEQTWDSAYGGSGNWPFNTAYAATKGLRAYVGRLGNLAEAEAFIQRGVPLALSIGWREGQLEGAHLPSSGGHLVVLRGFTSEGNPILNDPAAESDSKVRTIFPREAFERAWLGHSGGIAYVIEIPATY